MSLLENKFKVVIAAVVFIFCLNITVSAQSNESKSRVAVFTSDVKTNIWVSDFPKNASIVIYDGDNNLISITTTNNFGAAFLSLPKNLKSGVIVKTIDGEISATNKTGNKNNQQEQNIVSTDQDDSNKA